MPAEKVLSRPETGIEENAASRDLTEQTGRANAMFRKAAQRSGSELVAEFRAAKEEVERRRDGLRWDLRPVEDMRSDRSAG